MAPDDRSLPTDLMHILHVLYCSGRGGLVQAYLDMTDMLLAQGHRLTALIGPDTPCQQELEARQVPVLRVACRGFSDPLAAWRVRRILRSLQPDSILAHNSRAMQLLRKARGRRAIPLIGVSHSMKTKRAMGMDRMIVLTEAMREQFLAAGYAAEQLHLVPNAINLKSEGQRVQGEGLQGRDIIIGALGRFTEEKGFDLLIEAVALLRKKGQAVRLKLGGDGPLRAALAAQAAQRGIADQVQFAGWVEDKTAFFRDVDVCCVPSHEETFGLVVLEAWALGVPVVATDAYGPASLIVHGETGLLAPRGDATAFAKALQRLAADAALQRQLAEAGSKAVRVYRPEVVSQKLEQLMHSTH